MPESHYSTPYIADRRHDPDENSRLVVQGGRLAIGGAIASALFELGTRATPHGSELDDMQHISASFQLISVVISAWGLATAGISAVRSWLDRRQQ